MAMKQSSRAIFDYLKAHPDEDVTSEDLAKILGLEKRSIDGSFTSALQRKGYGVRIPAEAELEDGTHKAIKLLKLTPEGMAFDPDAPET